MLLTLSHDRYASHEQNEEAVFLRKECSFMISSPIHEFQFFLESRKVYRSQYHIVPYPHTISCWYRPPLFACGQLIRIIKVSTDKWSAIHL